VRISNLTENFFFSIAVSLWASIATHYGLDGPGIESQWGGEIFRTRPERPWGHPATLGTRSSLGVKLLGCGIDHPPPPSIAEVKERVELYLYSPSGPLWPVLGRTLTLPLLFTLREEKYIEKVKKRCLWNGAD
jgi:hypothetical protein